MATIALVVTLAIALVIIIMLIVKFKKRLQSPGMDTSLTQWQLQGIYFLPVMDHCKLQIVDSDLRIFPVWYRSLYEQVQVEVLKIDI